jgi:4a-hydroxytetrahydrobiopterin dehydratase
VGVERQEVPVPDELLTADEIATRLIDLHDDWSGAPDGLRRSIEFADFLTAVRFVDLLAPLCEQLNHHPDLDLRWRRVHITLATHSAGGVTAKDFQLAAVIDGVADDLPQAG